MKIQLSNTHIELFRTTHFYPWTFWHQFGWFADRHGSSMNSDNHNYWIETDREVTEEEITEIVDFFEDASNFEAPPYVHKVVLDLDYRTLKTKIDSYIKDDPTLDVYYVGEGPEQNLYCSRALTEIEKGKLIQLWSSMIKFL